jgi:hypothetical protein
MFEWLSPAFALGLICSVGYGALYHLWSGRTVTDLSISLSAALIGFGSGQVLGFFTQTAWLQIGQLHLVEATLGAWCALLILHNVQR